MLPRPWRRAMTLLALLLWGTPALAQDGAQDSTAVLPSKGRLYGLMFGDYFYKARADSLGRGGNQYAGVPAGHNAFRFRRIYLGYRYDFDARFTATLLMEANQGAGNQTDFDVIVKLANIRWRNIFPGSDLLLGRVSTPTYSLTDKVWSYRSVEKSLADRHGSPSYDFGLKLEGRIDPAGRWGYRAMVGDGGNDTGVRDRFKKFYGGIYTTQAGGRLTLDLYADYQRLDWSRGFHHDRSMLKLFAGYAAPKVTVGAEGFLTWLRSDLVRSQGALTDTVDAEGLGLSAFVHGPLWGKQLGFFARLDWFDPYTGTAQAPVSFHSLSPAFDPRNRQWFGTAGLDYAPIPHVHFMPNVWWSRYPQGVSGPAAGDWVYRLTFYFDFQ